MKNHLVYNARYNWWRYGKCTLWIKHETRVWWLGRVHQLCHCDMGKIQYIPWKRRVLWCWDRVLWQNRCALAAGSPYFEALFFSPLSAAEGKQRVNLTSYAMKTVELPALAEFLQLDLLLEKLVGSLRCSINIHNCFKWIKEVVCHTKALLNCY